MRNKPNKFLSNSEKQKTVLPGEVTPENAFTKLSIFATHAANKYKTEIKGSASLISLAKLLEYVDIAPLGFRSSNQAG